MKGTKKIGVISLGCDKNRVDTENMLYILSERGYELTPDADKADAVIINTCAFIDDSKKESLDAVFEFADMKAARGVKIILTGCLPARYKDSLFDELPEVDAFLGFADYERLPEVLDRVFDGERTIVVEGKDKPTEKRVLSTPYHTAYLKIADGCDNCCTYCAIPKIRGRFRSRDMDGLVGEAKFLIDEYGVKELNLVAQDVTRYGVDLYNRYALLELLDKLSSLDVAWIRLLYCYPELVSDDLINYIADNEKICNYIDIPLQHVNDRILKAMNRRIDGKYIRNLIGRIRNKSDEIAIRSSFIVGFPSESEEEYRELYDFISEYKLDYAGFFAYSREENTAAYAMNGQIDENVKRARVDEIRALQSRIIEKNNEKYFGKTLKVLYEGIDYDNNRFYGRPEFCAPEIDSLVYFTSKDLVEIGNFYDVAIKSADEYDLVGVIK